MFIKSTAPLLTAEQEYELGTKIANGDMDAAERLFESNIRLANSIAFNFIKAGKQYLEDDIYQSALIALHSAAKSFDIEKGVRFSTYATNYIKCELEKFMRQELGIKDPKFYSYVYLKVRRLEDDYLRENGRLPSEDYVIEKLGITKKDYSHVHTAGQVSSFTDMQEKNPFDDDTGEKTSLLNQISDSTDFAEEIALKDLIAKTLSCLNERDQLAIKMRFGLDGYPVMKICDIEKELGYAHNSLQKNISRNLEKMKKNLIEKQNFHNLGDVAPNKYQLSAFRNSQFI